MAHFASLSHPRFGRRAFLKTSVSAAAVSTMACFGLYGVAARRRGAGTWVLRQDDV